MDWARNGDWPQAKHSRFVLSKPHKWHVQEMGAGPTLLLLHGAGGATQSWRHMFQPLSNSYHLIAIDLPGQGFTKLGAQNRCGLQDMSEDIALLCDQEGWAPDALIGHSAGAAIALQMAQRMDTAPPIVGINAALGNFKGLAGVAFPLIAKALASTPWVAHVFTASNARPKSVQRLLDGTGSKLPIEDQEFYRRLVSDKSHVAGTLSMMAQWQLDPLLESLATHPSPTLLITGANDKAVPPATSTEVAAKMPDARVVDLPELGHLAHEENGPLIAAEMRSFLSAQLA